MVYARRLWRRIGFRGLEVEGFGGRGLDLRVIKLWGPQHSNNKVV